MFKHTVTYNDFNGNERTEDLYFHLSTPEVTRLEAEIGRPLDEYAQELSKSNNLKETLAFVENMLLNSYGRKTSDGRTFHKSKDLRTEFEYSQAYAEVFEQMLLNPDLARKFAEGVSDTGKARKNQAQPKVVKQ